jgi:hypothetical protein
VQKSKSIPVFILIATLVALPLAAYFLLPTFHNRVKYFIYTSAYFKQAHYLPGSNDAIRVISLKAGWNVLQEHPLTGVGSGDIFTETKKWDDRNYPSMIEEDKIYPSSEWLIYGDSSGWPGLLGFTVIMIIPFLLPLKHRPLWCMLHVICAFGFLLDMGLEVQFGVFLYSFIVLWWWKWLVSKTTGTDT